MREAHAVRKDLDSLGICTSRRALSAPTAPSRLAAFDQTVA